MVLHLTLFAFCNYDSARDGCQGWLLLVSFFFGASYEIDSASGGRSPVIASLDERRLWSFNTAQEFKTVNGIAATGGSIGSAGATVAQGMVFVGRIHGISTRGAGQPAAGLRTDANRAAVLLIHFAAIFPLGVVSASRSPRTNWTAASRNFAISGCSNRAGRWPILV